MTRRNRCLVHADTVTREIPAPAGGVVIETFVPWKMVRRGVRERIVTPLGEPEAFAGEASSDTGAEDSPLLRALGLAHHWQRLLDEGRVASVDGIAESEGLDISYVRRLLRLTLLAPDLIEAALNERLLGAVRTSRVVSRPLGFPTPAHFEAAVQEQWRQASQKLAATNDSPTLARGPVTGVSSTS